MTDESKRLVYETLRKQFPDDADYERERLSYESLRARLEAHSGGGQKTDKARIKRLAKASAEREKRGETAEIIEFPTERRERS
jgi:hypothetical protein